MQNTIAAVGGHLQSPRSGEWLPVIYEVSGGYLGVRPGAQDVVGVVPEVIWALADVSGVTELAPAADGRSTVEIRFASGNLIRASLPVDFRDQLCAQLAAAAATTQTPAASPAFAPPATAPVAPAAVPVAGTLAPADEPSVAGEPRGQGLRLAVFGLAALSLVLLAATGFLWQRSSQQQDRAVAAEEALQERTSEVASLTRKVEQTEAQLAEAQTEVGDLTTRISELSNEKAQVQDERNAAQEANRLGLDAASKMEECRNRLASTLSYVLDDLYIAAGDALDEAVIACDEADEAVAAFVATQ